MSFSLSAFEQSITKTISTTEHNIAAGINADVTKIEGAATNQVKSTATNVHNAVNLVTHDVTTIEQNAANAFKQVNTTINADVTNIEKTAANEFMAAGSLATTTLQNASKIEAGLTLTAGQLANEAAGAAKWGAVAVYDVATAPIRALNTVTTQVSNAVYSDLGSIYQTAASDLSGLATWAGSGISTDLNSIITGLEGAGAGVAGALSSDLSGLNSALSGIGGAAAQDVTGALNAAGQLGGYLAEGVGGAGAALGSDLAGLQGAASQIGASTTNWFTYLPWILIGLVVIAVLAWVYYSGKPSVVVARGKASEYTARGIGKGIHYAAAG